MNPSSRNRPRWGRVVACFLLGLALLDLGIAAFRDTWSAYAPHPYAYRFDACRRGRWDVVVIGGSPALYGLDPQVLAETGRGYNLALPLATTAEVYHAARHALQRPPRLVVYGICASDFKEDRVEPCGPEYLMDAADVVVWGRQRPEAAVWGLRKFTEGRLERAWQLFRYRHGIRRWAADRVAGWWPDAFPETVAEARDGLARAEAWRDGHGFVSPPPGPLTCLDTLKQCGCVQTHLSYFENYHIANYLSYLYRILDWAERSRVQLVLVDMPVSADLEEKMVPRAFADFRACLAEVESRRGLRVLRPTRAGLGLTDADFADLVHLNAAGAARLSAWVRDRIAEEGERTP